MHLLKRFLPKPLVIEILLTLLVESKLEMRIFSPKSEKGSKEYRKIPNISPGLIEARKHILGGLYSGGLYS